MKQTVIGIFKQGNEARQAREALVQNGISNALIEITSQVEPLNDRLTDGQMTSTKLRQRQAVTSHDLAEAMLSVQIDDGIDIERVTFIIDNYGANDINRFQCRAAGNCDSFRTSILL